MVRGGLESGVKGLDGRRSFFPPPFPGETRKQAGVRRTGRGG